MSKPRNLSPESARKALICGRVKRCSWQWNKRSRHSLVLKKSRCCDARFAASWFHWFFFGQTAKPAERFISADPEAWYTATAEHMGAEAYQDYLRAIGNPDTVHAMMEDYRAGLGIDRQHDEADRAAGRRIGCPLLFLWAAN